MYEPSTSWLSAATHIRKRVSRCDASTPRRLPSLGGAPERTSGELAIIARNSGSSSQRLIVLTLLSPAAFAASACVPPARSTSAAL
jgi:hypothetical protein